MISKWIIMITVVIVTIKEVCLQCPEIPLEFPNSTCLCGDSISLGAGWKKTCMEKFRLTRGFQRPYQVFYKLSYAINKQLVFDCNGNNDINFKAGLFANINAPKLSKMSFISCPIPNIPLYDMLNVFNITDLRFTSNKEPPAIALNGSFLNGMISLRRLIIEHSPMESISSDFLANGTELIALRIFNNMLKTIPEETFRSTPNLIGLDLGANDISMLPETVFHGLTKLKKLSLYKNNLTSLYDQSFKGLKNLQIFQIDNNKLTKLSKDAFADLVNLEQLSLGGNKFETLPPQLFKNTKNISVIAFSKNRFQYLPAELLAGLKNLSRIIFSDCNMTFHEDFFSHAENLEHVLLYNNRIKMISPLLFTRNQNLKTLKMELNDLKNLTDDMFTGLYKLKILSLTGNNIRSIQSKTFIDLISLETLYLKANELTTLDGNTFSTLQNLKKLDLSRNQIHLTQRAKPFRNLIRLTTLTFSHNNLTASPLMSNLIKLKTADFRYNNIEFLNPVDGLSDNARYLYNHNKIKTINMIYIKTIRWLNKDEELKKRRLNKGDIKQSFENPSTYYVSDNPIVCDCNIMDFILYLKKMTVMFYGSVPVRFHANNLKCAEPAAMKNLRVVEMEPDEPTCLISDQCPDNCFCQFRASNRTTQVKCDNTELQSLPTVIPRNTSVLYLQNVSITEKGLATLQNQQYENITHLFLISNKLSTFPMKYLPKKLKVLDLRQNQLQFMPEWLPEYSKTHDVQYYFGNNSWLCNCSAREFKSWLTQNHNKVIDIKNISCKAKGKYNRVLVEIPDSELCPTEYEPDALLISSTISVVIISVLIAVIAILYYKQKQNILVFLFTHNMCQFFLKEEDLDEDKLFDAFISYSYHNRDFVIDQLIPELEQKDPKYNLCIHERNFMPGKTIVENIINAIELSRRTVIILSKDFVESDWGMLEFSIAHHQMLKDCISRVVIVVIDELSEKAKSIKELQFFLSTKTYLKKDELWFWDKLRYALPRRPIYQKKINGPLLVMPNIDQQKKLKPKIEEVKGEINEKIALKLADKNSGDHFHGSLEKKLSGIMNPNFNEDSKIELPKPSAIQMQPRNKQQKPVMCSPGIIENLV